MASGRYISDEGKRSLFSIFPPFLYAILLMLIPLGAVVIISFQVRGVGNGFGNYATVFTDPINVRGVVRGGDWLSPLVYTSVLVTALTAVAIVLADMARLSTRTKVVIGVLIPAIGLVWYLLAVVVGRGIWLPGLLPRSLMVSIAVTLTTVILAYPVAYFISFKVHPSRKSLWLFLITIPFWTSYLIRIFLWKVILGYSGVVNTALGALGLIDEPLTFILYNANAVVITLAHAYAPFAILPIFVALEKIDRSLKEASLDLGETRFTTFLRVTLPLSVPGIVAAVLIVFIPTIGDYVTPELVGGSQGLLIANRIQSLFLQVNDPGLGSALSMVTMLSVGLVSLLFVLALGRWLRRA